MAVRARHTQRFLGRSTRSHLGARQRIVEGTRALPQLPLLRLRFGLMSATSSNLPVCKGRLFYDVLWYHLKTMWCHQIGHCQDGCRDPNGCLFGHLIEPPVNPSWPPPMRRWINHDQPSSYVIWDEADQRTQITDNEVFYFELALIGEVAIRQVPAFVATMMVAGEQGIGRGQRQFKARLAQVTVLNSASEPACALMTGGVWYERLIEDLSLGYANGEEWSASRFSLADGLATRLHIWFRSPTRLEAQGKVVSEPRFSTLWQAIVRRLRILSQLYGAGDLSLSEYQPLLTIANQVQLDRHETTWIGSAKQRSRDTAEAEQGFMGHAWYSAPIDLRPLLPILWLGQWVHVGKGAAYGGGRYQVEVCT